MTDTPPTYIHRNGCAFCRHIRVMDARWRCTHQTYPTPTDWEDARDDDSRCGHSGRYWEEVDAGGRGND
jgi:hypothetical protein